MMNQQSELERWWLENKGPLQKQDYTQENLQHAAGLVGTPVTTACIKMLARTVFVHRGMPAEYAADGAVLGMNVVLSRHVDTASVPCAHFRLVVSAFIGSGTPSLAVKVQAPVDTLQITH
jgi:hypothetical protein